MLSRTSCRANGPVVSLSTQQIRHATLIRRPKRPYTFTQLITLSDGSTFTHRTTSPQPVYSSTRDTKNSALWNPSSQKLLNVEEDEAGRLRRFRQRFGRGFDIETAVSGEQAQDAMNEKSNPGDDEDTNLLDLISGYGRSQDIASVTPQEKKGAKAKGK